MSLDITELTNYIRATVHVVSKRYRGFVADITKHLKYICIRTFFFFFKLKKKKHRNESQKRLIKNHIKIHRTCYLLFILLELEMSPNSSIFNKNYENNDN